MKINSKSITLRIYLNAFTYSKQYHFRSTKYMINKMQFIWMHKDDIPFSAFWYLIVFGVNYDKCRLQAQVNKNAYLWKSFCRLISSSSFRSHLFVTMHTIFCVQNIMTLLSWCNKMYVHTVCAFTTDTKM